MQRSLIQTYAEVLLVEDDPGDVELVQEALIDEPLHVNLRVVHNGADALAYLRQQGSYQGSPMPHLILLDLNLPYPNGRYVLSEIKNDEQLKNIPVVVFTTSDAIEDITSSYNLGANCYVLKESNLEGFLLNVQSILRFWINIAQLP